MKKKLVVLLAVVMMFAFAASAYAVDFTDLSEQPVTVQDAVAKTTALGIIEGYSDGTFGPEQNITRAEFAKIAVTAAGAKDTAAMLEKNASTFKDVKAGQWYTGWINASESLGIFQGDGNGNFRPNDSISNQEVITVLMRLLGYNDNLTGTWPVNYVTQANKDGILDNVTVVAAAAAKRADVVVMLDDTLDTDIVTYDKDTNEFVKKQTTKSGSSVITLLEDSFKGSYYKVNNFPAVTQVRDAAKQTLNWDITYTFTKDDGSEGTGSGTLIIDKETEVSYNGGTLFDLANHQGNVYYVKDGDKYYARFIEVESYTKTVTTAPKEDGTKVAVGKTNYNKADKIFWTNLAGGAADDKGAFDKTVTAKKNSKWILFFNDDDQVYRVMSDKDYEDNKSYYVKSVGSSSVKLVNGKGTTSTANLKDNDSLIWNGKEFVAPSTLKKGDAIQFVANDLYVMVDEVSGKLTKVAGGKATIDGKSYVYTAGDYIDEDLEDAGVEDADVYGNEVKYILNKDNKIATIMVGETSTGTTLYGIVTDGDEKSGSWNQGTLNGVTVFTAEGKTVAYDIDSDIKDAEKPAKAMMGKLVKYQLNKDNEVKKMTLVGNDLLSVDADKEIEIKNNAYLVAKDNAGTTKTLSLASNVVIFEVDVDSNHKVDPVIVNRSSLLAGGDFKPQNTKNTLISNNNAVLTAYCLYDTNSNGAVKAMAYTEAGGTTYHYAIVDGDAFQNADYNDRDTNGWTEAAVQFVGDDTVYELDASALAGANTNDKLKSVKNGMFVVYKLSGDTAEVVYTLANKGGMDSAKTLCAQVTGTNDGLLTLKGGQAPKFNQSVTGTPVALTQVMTDSETIVYVNGANGYELGELSDAGKDTYVYVPVVDEDGYADVVLVDDYTTNRTTTTTPTPEQFTVTLTDTNDTKAEMTAGGKKVNSGDKVDKGTVITVTVPDTAWTPKTDETGKTITIKVGNATLTADSNTTKVTITENTTITVTRTVVTQ